MFEFNKKKVFFTLLRLKKKKAMDFDYTTETENNYISEQEFDVDEKETAIKQFFLYEKNQKIQKLPKISVNYDEHAGFVATPEKKSLKSRKKKSSIKKQIDYDQSKDEEDNEEEEKVSFSNIKRKGKKKSSSSTKERFLEKKHEAEPLNHYSEEEVSQQPISIDEFLNEGNVDSDEELLGSKMFQDFKRNISSDMDSSSLSRTQNLRKQKIERTLSTLAKQEYSMMNKQTKATLMKEIKSVEGMLEKQCSKEGLMHHVSKNTKIIRRDIADQLFDSHDGFAFNLYVHEASQFGSF